MASTLPRAPLDPLTAASVTIAWVILGNKPFYPLYVWWLVGDGVRASLATLIAVPFFAAIPLLVRRSPMGARIALPFVGTVDTLFETKLFGAASGTELFLAPCLMLVALSFRVEEKWWQRGLALAIFCVFAITHNRFGTALHAWSTEQLTTLLNLNSFAVASLMAFITLRYAALRRDGP